MFNITKKHSDDRTNLITIITSTLEKALKFKKKHKSKANDDSDMDSNIGAYSNQELYRDCK